MFTDPYQWYGRLSDERCVRAPGGEPAAHHKGWSRQQAIGALLANSSMAESRRSAEVERYISLRLDTGYKIGQWEISKLRTEAQAALGPRFDVKKFHRLVLTSGALPMTVLRETVMEWIRRKK